MATANNLTDTAYRKIGIKSPSDTEDTEALETLNNMIGTWGIEFLFPSVERDSLSLTIGQAEYTVGSGGDFDRVRPIGIIDVYLRNSDGYDYPVKVISGRDYNDIALKTAEGRPTKLYFVPEVTLAKIFFNREPDEAYTAYFEFRQSFTELELTDTITLPNEYKEAIVYNLAVKLAEDPSIDLPASVARTAATTLILISRLIAVNQMPPKSKFDFNGSGTHDIVTGE